jgi:hypothetical protein
LQGPAVAVAAEDVLTFMGPLGARSVSMVDRTSPALTRRDRLPRPDLSCVPLLDDA